MIQKIQRFGAAMFTPVLLFSFAGLVLAFALTFTNPMIVGGIADGGSHWYRFWKIVENGAWTVFVQMELLFVVGLAVGLAKKANGRAAMEALVIYFTFNYFINAILTYYGESFHVDLRAGVGGVTGLKMIAGVTTLDTGILGAIGISLLTVLIHEKYFDKKLPDFLGVFQGSAFVVILGFIAMLPIALLTVVIWPNIQHAIGSIQAFLAGSGGLGVWIYTFLERSLIPTGLHHFIYSPFMFGPAAVESGIRMYWVEHLSEFASSARPLVELFPQGGFGLYGNSKVFGSLGISIAFYLTAFPDKKKKVLAILLPAALTAVLTGITEPLEFTFLFIAPVLFFIHAFLAACMSTTMYLFGVVGDLGNGLIDFVGLNWIPMAGNHFSMILSHIIIGLLFTAIYVLVFRYLILRFQFVTPGREMSTGDTKLYTKQDLKDKKNRVFDGNEYERMAALFMEGLGGRENVESFSNCATRLRVVLKDMEKLSSDSYFKSCKAHGVVRKGNTVQIIVGLSVPQVREQFETLFDKKKGD